MDKEDSNEEDVAAVVDIDLADGTEVKRCNKYNARRNHYRAGHSSENDDIENVNDGANGQAGLIANEGLDSSDGSGDGSNNEEFSRLRAAGLI